MNKLEKAILFFALFTIFLMFGRKLDIGSLNLSIDDAVFLAICYGIALYSTLGAAAYNLFSLIGDTIHKK